VSDTAPGFALVLHIALLSIISFGGMASVLPDLRHFVVTANGWLTDREFANFFAIAQALPGPNMLFMMGVIGWRVGGLPTALATGIAAFGPPCVIYYFGYGLWQRSRQAPWHLLVRRALAPLTAGLIVGGGIVMAHTADTNWRTTVLTIAGATLILLYRVNPLWILLAAGGAGGLGLL
jgi:chromate transporter